jgi:hypothetical protein
MTDIHDIKAEAIDPVARLLKALVEVNYYSAEARSKGWGIALTTGYPGHEVDVKLSKDRDWPMPAEPVVSLVEDANGLPLKAFIK